MSHDLPRASRRRQWLALAASFTASVALAAWLPAHAQQAKPEQLRIGFQKSASLLTLQKSQGTLEKRLAPLGVAVKWVEFPAGPQLLEGLNVGAVDVGFVGEAPPIFAQAAGARFVYIGNDPAAPEAEAIVVAKDSPIKSVAELKGKKLALNKGSNAALPAGQGAGEERPEVRRHPAGVPAAGRCAHRLRARRGRCLGHLGPVPGRGGKTKRRTHPGRRPRRGQTTPRTTWPSAATPRSTRRCCARCSRTPWRRGAMGSKANLKHAASIIAPLQGAWTRPWSS